MSNSRSVLDQLSPPLMGALADLGATRPSAAVSRVFVAPHATLDDSPGRDALTKAILNFVDACAFGEGHQVYITARSLTDLLEQHRALDAVPGLRAGLELIRSRSAVSLDRDVLRTYFADPARRPWARVSGVVLAAEQQNRPLNDPEIGQCLRLLSETEHAALKHWIFFVQGNVLFRAVKGALHRALGAPTRPEAQFAYGGAPEVGAVVAALEAAYASNRVPVVIFEPYALDWSAVKRTIAGKPALFLFRHKALLAHALQFPELFEALLDPNHVLYTLDAFPEEALREQPVLASWAASRAEGELFAPIVLDEGMRERARTMRVIELIEHWLRERTTDAGRARDAAYWLYRVALCLRDELTLQRLGGARTFAYLNGAAADAWTSPHKGLAPAAAAPDLSFPDHIEARLAPLRERRAPRPIGRTRPLRLAHVVPQIVDGGHAPSRLLRTLMEHHDRKRFEPQVFVTERLVMRSREYPMSTFTSPPTGERAVATLATFEAKRFRIDIDPATSTFEESGERLAQRLSAAKIDVAVFHGPDFINLVAAQFTDVPYRVFFEHGTLPGHPGFELVLASTEDSAVLHKEAFAQRGARIVAHPFYVNCRENWKPEPYALERFGVPADAQIMTTVTNHLEARCSDDMVWAIAEILRRNPRAWYMPIGGINDPQALGRRFEAAGAPNRIRFIGPSSEPSQLARSMKLFLNEFPFGSCLGMLDAMAAGCVPVTMYDPNGPVQARYGGMFMGLDRVITSLRREDYVDLASRLLSDDAMFAEWSAVAQASYESRTDLAGYVRKLEALLDELVAGGEVR